MLHFDVHGRNRDSRVVLVHGFTQTRESWMPLVPRLAADHQVLTVDAPGHGLSRHFEVDLWEGSHLLGQVGRRAAYVGYSMGGRIALHLAVAQPDLVDRLVLVGATAGIDAAEDRAVRRATDEALAVSLERDGVDAFLDRWLANPLFATLPRDRAGLDSRRQNTAEGLAASLRLMGTGTQEPLWDRLPKLSMPALFVAGEHDDKFLELAHRLARSWGGSAVVATVAGAGHACHLENPDGFLDLVVPFLKDAHSARTPVTTSTPNAS